MLPRPSAAVPRGGAVTVWLIVSLSVIIGIVALGMDGGRMMEERRLAQAAADAAALAAATDMYLNYAANQGTDPYSTAQAIAQANALANGYANDGATSIVTVNIPPKSGAFAGQIDYVEVIIQANLQAGFSAVFTSQPLQVQARAVAHGAPKRFGLLLLQPDGSDSLALSGNASVQVVNAPIIVNSNDPLAYDIIGSATVSASRHDLAGSAALNLTNIIGPVHMNVPPTADPLLSLPEPDPSSYTMQASSTTSISGGSVTLQPGVYRGGINVSGKATVTLAPGIYVLDGGGLQVSGQADVIVNGVMLYNTGGSNAGSINISGRGDVTLAPPTQGPYTGINLFQARDVSQSVQISGNGAYQITGTVYAPAAPIQLSGNGTISWNTLGGSFIASRLQVTGNGSFRISHAKSRPRVPDVYLVE
jgi:hypothetical protein